LCHRDNEPSTCEGGRAKSGGVKWAKAVCTSVAGEGERAGKGLWVVELGETLFEGGRRQQEEGITTAYCRVRGAFDVQLDQLQPVESDSPAKRVSVSAWTSTGLGLPRARTAPAQTKPIIVR